MFSYIHDVNYDTKLIYFWAAKNCFLFKQKFGFYHVWLLKTIQVIYHLSFSFIPIQKKAFFLIPTQYSVLYIQSRKHLIKKSPTLLLLYTDIHTNLYCIFLFSMLDVKSKEKLKKDRKKISICWTELHFHSQKLYICKRFRSKSSQPLRLTIPCVSHHWPIYFRDWKIGVNIPWPVEGSR